MQPQLAISTSDLISFLKENHREWYFNISDRLKKPSNEEIFNYLDSVSSEAEVLANVWQQLTQKLIQDEIDDDASVKYRIKRDLLYGSGLILCGNERLFYRLRGFYELFPITIRDKLGADLSEKFSSGIDILLGERMKTKDALEMYFGFPNDENFKSLLKSVEILQKQAAMLHVLAKTARISELC